MTLLHQTNLIILYYIVLIILNTILTPKTIVTLDNPRLTSTSVFFLCTQFGISPNKIPITALAYSVECSRHDVGDGLCIAVTHEYKHMLLDKITDGVRSKDRVAWNRCSTDGTLTYGTPMSSSTSRRVYPLTMRSRSNRSTRGSSRAHSTKARPPTALTCSTCSTRSWSRRSTRTPRSSATTSTQRWCGHSKTAHIQSRAYGMTHRSIAHCSSDSTGMGKR